MSIPSKAEFARLVDNLTREQYEDLITVVAAADVDIPGWRDRALRSDPTELDSDPVSFCVSFADWESAIALAQISPCEVPGHWYGGIWIEVRESQLQVITSNNKDAHRAVIDAEVFGYGRTLVDARDVRLLTEALRKGMPASVRRNATLTVTTEDSHLRLSAHGRSHRVATFRRSSDAPTVPPTAEIEVLVADGPALGRAILHVAAAADEKGSADVLRTDRIGFRASDGFLTLDGTDRYAAAEATIPATHESQSFDVFVDSSWLKRVGNLFRPGPARIGVTQENGTDVLMLANGTWTAWTTGVGSWRKRFTPLVDTDRTSVVVARRNLHRFLTEADRLAGSGKVGTNDWRVRFVFADETLHISSLDDSSSARAGSLHLRVEHESGPGSTSAYLDVRRTLRALRRFSSHNVAIHFGAADVAYVTNPGAIIERRPALLWGMRTSPPEDPGE
ncbi:hypothetical protein [Microbacterium sp. LWH11-1.2]|uniref:hypothetical protein n=1 Tax=unclassified Microbacterium TaxID=2609290 RepID=UPI00313A0ABC